MSDKNKKDDFLMQGAILALAAVLTKVLGLAYRIPLTNILGDEGNGFYGYAFEVYSIALILSTFSFPVAVSKLVSARMAVGQKRNAFRVFSFALLFSAAVGLVISLGVFFGAGKFSSDLMESPLSIYSLKMLAPALFVVSVMGVFRGYFQGLGTMVPTAVSQVIEQLFNAIFSIVGAALLFKAGQRAAQKHGNDLLAPAYGAAGGTFGTLMGALAGLVFLVIVFLTFKRRMKTMLRSDRRHRAEKPGRILKLFVMTVIPVIFTTAIYNINQIIDLTLFNKIMASLGFAEKEYMALQGIYTGKYNTLINVPLAMANGLAASVIPSVTAAAVAGDRPKILRNINKTIRFTMLVAIPCFTGYVILASPIMVLLFNDPNTTPARLLACGAVTVIFYSQATVTNSILQGMDMLSCPVKNAAISLVLHLGAYFVMLFVFKWNIYALAGSNIIFSICMSLLNMRDIKKATGYRQEVAVTFIKPAISAAIMGVFTYTTYNVAAIVSPGRFFAALLSVFISVIVYSVCILKTGCLSETDIKDLPKGEQAVTILKKLRMLPQVKSRGV